MSDGDGKLSNEEITTISLLEGARERFADLDIRGSNSGDQREFDDHIHALQHMVMARPTRRANHDLRMTLG